MDFRLNEEQLMLRNTVKEFVEKEAKPVEQAILRGQKPEDPLALLRKAYAMGLSALPLSPKWGGIGAGMVTCSVVLEELGKAPSSGLFVIMENLAMARMMEYCYDDEQKAEFAPRFVNDHTFHIRNCTTDMDSRSDWLIPYDGPGAAGESFAYRDGDDYILNGSKFMGSPMAKLLHIWCRTDKNKPISQAMSLFLVPAETPGVSVGQRWNFWGRESLGMEMGTMCETVLANVRVPVRYRVGEENEAFPIRHKVHDLRHIMNTAKLVGTAQDFYEQTLEFAKTRVQGGKPIIQHTNVAMKICDMQITVEALRALVYKLAWELDNRDEVGFDNKLVYELRVFAHELLTKFYLVDAAEIWGATGMLRESALGSQIVMFLAMSHPGGTPDVSKLKAIRLGLGAEWLPELAW